MNENYIHPAMPEGAAEGIVRGMYRLREGATGKQARVQLFGSGAILREVEAAAVYLEEQYNIAAGIWSITSYSELRRDGIDCEHWNLRHPEQTPQQSYVAGCLQDVYGPFIAASDYMRSVPDQIRQWVPGAYHVLGTDGFGRSDSRRALRAHFEVNRNNIVLATLRALADEGAVERSLVSKAILDLELDADKPNPVKC